jgi:cell shape-determining protein MreC
VSAAHWIWAVTLAVVTFVVVPLAIVLLHRTLAAASAIERYTREALQAGVGIAENTGAVAALEETIAAATSLLETSQKLSERTAEIAKAVSAGKE